MIETWVSALVLAALVSLFVTLAGVALLSVTEDRLARPHDRVLVWRAVRMLAILPFLIAALSMQFGDRLIVPEPQTGGQMASLSVLDPILDAVRGATGNEAAEIAETSNPQIPASSAHNRFDIPWATLSGLAYLTGMLFALGRFVLRRMALSVLMAGSRAPDSELDRLFERWLKTLRLSARPIRLRIVDAPISPFVIGLMPRVFLPQRLALQSARKTAELALVHELIHVRRGDEWDRIIGEFFSVIFWFNPMLGWVEHRLAHVRELACDAETLDVLGKERRRAYAGALVEAARAEPLANSKVMAFGTQHKRSRLMRVKAILSGNSESRSSFGFKCLLAAGAAAVLIPACAAQAMMTAAMDSAAPPNTGVAPVAVAATVLARQNSELTSIRSAINSSPLASLERLEALEALSTLNPQSMAMNPANWAAIGAFAMGQSESLSLTLEDENGNPMHVSIREGEDGDFVELDFVDDNGVRNYLIAHDESNGEEVVSLRYEGAEEPHFSVMSGEDDTARIRFTDDSGAPIRFDVSEEGDDAIIEIEDLQSGDASTLRFRDNDDGMVRAPADGRISHVGNDTAGEEPVGQYVVIDHGTGWSTIFYNLADVSVSQGQRINDGDVVGTEGDEDNRGNYDFDFNDVNVAFVRTATLRL